MEETPLQTAESLLDEERYDMLIAAKLVHTRLGKLIERGGPGGFDLPTIMSLLGNLQEAIWRYRLADAVVDAMLVAGAKQQALCSEGGELDDKQQE